MWMDHYVCCLVLSLFPLTIGLGQTRSLVHRWLKRLRQVLRRTITSNEAHIQGHRGDGRVHAQSRPTILTL